MTYTERAKGALKESSFAASMAAVQPGDENLCYENCGGGGGDGPSGTEYATGQDIADAVAAISLMDAEVEAMLQTVNLAEYALRAAPATDSKALSQVLSSASRSFELMPATAPMIAMLSGCAGPKGLVAIATASFANSWWRVAVAAAVVDPEPISKVTLGIALVAAAASYAAVGYAVNHLYDCQNP